MGSFKLTKGVFSCQRSWRDWSPRLKLFTDVRQQLSLSNRQAYFFSKLPNNLQIVPVETNVDILIAPQSRSRHKQNQLNHKVKVCEPKPLLDVKYVTSQPYSTQHNHENTLPEESANDLLGDIHNSIVYSNDDIIALNKPAGLSVYGTTSDANSTARASIHGSLPEWRRKLQSSYLGIGLSLKSYYSGLVVLCKKSDSQKKLERCLRESAAQKAQIFTYLVITVGQPTCSPERECSAFVSRDFIHGREMSLIQEKSNTKARKAGDMMLACFNARTLRVNDSLGVALMEISINRDRWEAVEALMSYHLSPVLGDNVYSSRTMYVMGVPFRAAAHSVQPCQQRLPPPLKQALEDFEPTWKDHPGSIPLYIHRHRIKLNKFPDKTSIPLILTAPPPKHFLSLVKHLDLYTDNMEHR